MKENEGERAMDAGRNDHPDEGTIHAWLDGAFDAPTASALEAHVASCPSCTERVAEARGLIAGASRVVGALDDVPAGVAPAWGRPSSTARSSRRVSAWRRLRVTPARAAIAATILIALGVTLTKQYIAPEMDVAPSVAATSAQRAAPIRPRDALLDSAVKRNIAAAVPPRSVQAAPGPDIAVPLPGSQPPAVAADTTAGLRVAVGRTSMRRHAEADVVADRAAVSGAPAGVAREPERRALAASIKADSAAALSVPASKEVPEQRLAVAPECYRVESANGIPAAWGAVPLPFVVTLDPIGRSAHLLAADGISDGRVTWTRTGDDSLTFHLRRLGYTGTLTLGGAGDVRPGVMRSASLKLQLGETVVTGTASAEYVPPGKSAPAARTKAPTMVPGPTKPAAAPPPPQNAAVAEPAIAVVARRVGCAR
jgi:Putative zinc-finger